ncbi:hypothetical protein AV530_007688 [Patagioenas fasciata monilis]|uniref:Uncharacterized protein n=1 Tax=Patagioenas fasciata monilis TaxID=372326 RepID=A0A1V4JYR0_PATFA|nr:hypothetical protein AV530_007688 [Patagioenas fasciata monilis]
MEINSKPKETNKTNTLKKNHFASVSEANGNNIKYLWKKVCSPHPATAKVIFFSQEHLACLLADSLFGGTRLSREVVIREEEGDLTELPQSSGLMVNRLAPSAFPKENLIDPQNCVKL